MVLCGGIWLEPRGAADSCCVAVSRRSYRTQLKAYPGRGRRGTPEEKREQAEPQRSKEASAVIGGGPEGTLQDQNQEMLDLTLHS